jgi:hypothetical protein
MLINVQLGEIKRYFKEVATGRWILERIHIKTEFDVNRKAILFRTLIVDPM